MRVVDILGMCVQDLRRRKVRTLLTSLGVLVGTCSIVIMVSIGFGLSEQMDKTLAQMGDLTVITVNPPSGGGAEGSKLDEAAVEAFRAIDGVRAVSPKIQLDGVQVSLSAGVAGRYTCSYATVIGMEADALDAVGYIPAEGSPIEASGTSRLATGRAADVLVGQWLAYDFVDSYLPEGMNYVDRYSYLYETSGMQDGLAAEPAEPPEPFFDILAGQITLDITDYDGNPIASYKLKPVGKLAEDYNKGYETSSGIVMDLADLETIRAAVGRVSSSQAPNPSSSREDAYGSAIVKVEDISLVASVEQAISEMGYPTYSMESIREPMEEQARQQQLMLGGLGAISLFVAALGITNTMVMSISERKRDIGVMKALGCYVRDIKLLFLSEAGAIGLIGGLAGCIVSFVASLAMNVVSVGSLSTEAVVYALFGGEVARMSVIPWWLYPAAVAFAMLVGLASGFYPAHRTVRISAIEAIRGSE